jgi:hypothetical protein
MADQDNFVGTGWENKGGIRISIKKDKIAELETNQYGDVILFVGKLREPNEKSHATHFVKVNESKPQS